jgi:DNA-binding XRE family transcriptional regulator
MPRQNTNPANFPQAVLLQIEQLAHNITIARKRRGETQAQWAKKLGVSQPTFARIERGDPGVAMASYVMCMWLIDPEVGLADLISPLNDHAALEREVSRVSPARRRPAPANLRKRAPEGVPAPRKARAAEAREPHGNALPVAQKGVVKPKEKGNATAEGLAALLKTGVNTP